MSRAHKSDDRRGNTSRERIERAGLQGLVTVIAFVVSIFASACIIEGTDGGFGATCMPRFADGDPCEPACNASRVVIVNGNPYCTQTCGPNNECPFGHICVRFAPGDIPDSACLVPCRTGADCPRGFLGLCSPEGICGL